MVKTNHMSITRLTQSLQQQRPRNPAFQLRRVIIKNKHGEKLVGLLHDTGSKKLVIVCHGFQSSKERIPMVNLAAAIEKEGISAYRFDFAGNGESEGSFQYGNYRREADDLLAIVQHFRGLKRVITAVIGHSKGMFEYRVTQESLMDRLTTDTHAACLLIKPDCRALTVHGSMDKIVPVEDASEFAKFIPNHKLHMIEGADHEYTSHQDELASIGLDFLREDFNPEKSMLSLPLKDHGCNGFIDTGRTKNSLCGRRVEVLRI